MARDTSQFEEYVAARWSACFRTAYLMVGDRGHAEDLVQAALSRCYGRWHTLREPAAADAYVRRAMLNELLSWRRRRSWGRELSTEVLPEVAEDRDRAADEVDQRAQLRSVLDTLPPRQRAVVVLRFYEDLSVQDTARAMGCSTGTVKSQTSVALAALRGRLGDLQANESGAVTTVTGGSADTRGMA